MAAMPNLFDELSSIRSAEIPIVLRPAQMVPGLTGAPIPIALRDSRAVHLKVHAISPNELVAADSILDRASPPVIMREEPNPKGVGMVQVQAGYDYDQPAYVAARQRLLPLRHAMICLAGCTALTESTPGESLEHKAQLLCDKLGAAVVGWLAEQIENLAFLTAVGDEQVAAFFQQGSGGSPSSPGSNSRSRQQKKSAGSKSSTRQTSNTSSERRRTTGG